MTDKNNYLIGHFLCDLKEISECLTVCLIRYVVFAIMIVQQTVS